MIVLFSATIFVRRVVIYARLCHNFFMVTREEIREFARGLGFDDVRFARANELLKETSGALVSPESILEGAGCLIVLFAGYFLNRPADEKTMALSPYYITSNASYHAAGRLVSYLDSRGIAAVHSVRLCAKSAALKTGGSIGDNGFYYHDRLGSLVCIQTVVTSAALPPDEKSGRTECLHCGACARACPSTAVGNITACLRYHINGPVPENLRKDIYQLLGCEKCQAACPLNSSGLSEPVAFSLEELITGYLTKEIKDLAGTNLVRKTRLISQAVLYAAKVGAVNLAPLIGRIAECANEPLLTHARWAYRQLTGEDINDHA